MDPTDFAVIRWLSPDGVASFWGSRRVIDPRITAHDVAERVGISETAVRARLKGLVRRGLLAGRELWPNPSLFGVSVVRSDLPVTNPREAARLLDRLGEVDGVVHARDVLDPVQRRLVVYYIADRPSETAKRLSALRRLAGLSRLPTSLPVPTPKGPARIGPADWALLREMSRHPEFGVGRLAQALGVSARTTARRFHALLDARACWYTPGPRTVDGPWSYVLVTCAEGARTPEVEADVRRQFSCWMPVAPENYQGPGGASTNRFGGLLLMESLGDLERDVRRIETVPGVASAFQVYSLASRTYPRWFYERIDERARSRPGAGEPSRSPRAGRVKALRDRPRTTG